MIFRLTFFKRVNKKVTKTFKTLDEAQSYASKKHLFQYEIDEITYLVL